MKQYGFLVVFANKQTQTVFAFCEEEAIILAKAEQIKACLPWQYIVSIRIVD